MFILINESHASVYYIDYDQGKNKNIGTKKEFPLKNYPGDPNATEKVSNITLVPGDEIIFKGGVKYKGALHINVSGTPDLPIVFNGNSNGYFGNGMAIVDGSDTMSNISKCKHPSRDKIIYCVRNVNVKNSIGLNLFSGNRKLYESNSVNIDDFYLRTNLDKYTTADDSDIGSNYLKIKDKIFYKLLGSWSNASLIVWGKGNQIYRRNILRADEKTKRIYFKPVSFHKKKKYIVVNAAPLLDSPGEYYFDVKNNVIYIYPFGDKLTELSYASQKVGVDISAENIVVKGFIIEKNGSVDVAGRVGVGIKIHGRSKFNPVRNVRINNNILRNHKAIDKSGVITVLNGDEIQIINNKIQSSSPNRGILVNNSNNVITKNNFIENVTGTGIAYFRVSNGRIEGNLINNINGVHSNGISVYLKSINNFVFNNCVANGLHAFTTNQADLTIVAANIFHSNEDRYTAADWGGSNNLYFYNNVFLNPHAKSLYVSKNTNGVKVINSIIDGLLLKFDSAFVSHNIYTKLSWQQNSRYKWKAGAGDILKYVNSTKKKIIFSYPYNGINIKLPFEKDLEMTNIGYPFKVRDSCEQLINGTN